MKLARSFLCETVLHRRQLLFLHPNAHGAERFFALVSEILPGISAARWHGAIGDGERARVFDGFRSGGISVVVGDGSAAFLPSARLGAIVVDGEEDPAHFHRRGSVHFNCRDVAVRRAQLEDAQCLLLTPSPSLEMYYAAKRGQFEITVDDSHSCGPTVSVVDLSRLPQREQLLSPRLLCRLKSAIAAGKKSLLIHPRSGMCRSYCLRCEELLRCPKCDLPITYVGKEEGHLCDRCSTALPAKCHCPKCGSHLKRIGSGIGKVELLLRKYFPQTTCRRWKENGNCADIFIDSDFDPVAVDDFDPALVAFLDGDSFFCGNNFRSGERAFQFLWRTSDAVGGDCELLLQTSRPECAPLVHFLSGSRISFCEDELAARSQLAYPPYRHLVVQRFSSKDQCALESFVGRWSDALNGCQQAIPDFEWKGPKFLRCLDRSGCRSIEFWIFTSDPSAILPKLKTMRSAACSCDTEISEILDVDAL